MKVWWRAGPPVVCEPAHGSSRTGGRSVCPMNEYAGHTGEVPGVREREGSRPAVPALPWPSRRGIQRKNRPRTVRVGSRRSGLRPCSPSAEHPAQPRCVPDGRAATGNSRPRSMSPHPCRVMSCDSHQGCNRATPHETKGFSLRDSLPVITLAAGSPDRQKFSKTFPHAPVGRIRTHHWPAAGSPGQTGSRASWLSQHGECIRVLRYWQASTSAHPKAVGGLRSRKTGVKA